MAYAVVQSKRTGISGSPPYTTAALGAFTTNPVVGNRIIVVTEQWQQAAGRPAATVSDSVNGTYTKHLSASINDGGFLGEIAIHSVVVTASASTNPTASYSAATANGGIIAALEVSGLGSVNGVGAVDVQTSTGGGAGGTATSGATSATSAANELALFLYGDDGWGVSMSSGQQEATWTWLDGLTGGQTGSYLTAYKSSGASGSTVNGQMNSGVPGGSVTWALAVAVFKLAGGGGGTTQSVVGSSAGLASMVAQLRSLRRLLVTSAGLASASAIVRARRSIGARTSAGIATAAGVLGKAGGPRTLSAGRATGVASAAGSLGTRRLLGSRSAAGVAVATMATLGRVKSLSAASAAGRATVAAVVYALHGLSGVSVGGSSTTSTVRLRRGLSAGAAGSASATGHLSGGVANVIPRNFNVRSDGHASTWTILVTYEPPPAPPLKVETDTPPMRGQATSVSDPPLKILVQGEVPPTPGVAVGGARV
jgi:hypothetical protein